MSFCFREKEGFCHFLPAAAGFSQFLSRTSRQGVLLLSPLPPTQSEPVSPFSMKKGLTFSRFRERKKCANCPVFDSCVNSCYSFTENVRRAICRLFDTYVISYYSFTTGTRQKIQCRFDTYVISCYSSPMYYTCATAEQFDTYVISYYSSPFALIIILCVGFDTYVISYYSFTSNFCNTLKSIKNKKHRIPVLFVFTERCEHIPTQELFQNHIQTPTI